MLAGEFAGDWFRDALAMDGRTGKICLQYASNCIHLAFG